MSLPEIRRELDIIDTQIVTLIAKRQSYMQEVGVYKREHNLPLRHPDREQEIVARLTSLAHKHDVNPKLITTIFRALFKDAIRIQKDLQ